MKEYDYEALRADSINKGFPRYVYEPIDEPLIKNPAALTIPDYLVAHVEKQNAKVKEILESLRSFETFAFFSDAHVRQNSMNACPVLRSILENTPVRTVLYGGDTVSAWVDEETAREDVRYFADAFSFAKPYMTRGNHDVYGKRFGIADRGVCVSNEEVYDLIFRKDASRVIGEKGKTYYYFDHTDTKTRYVVVDTNDVITPVWDADGIWNCEVRVSETQIRWFVDLLLATPHDYAIIVCGHIPMFAHLPWHHSSAMLFGDLIEAFNAKRTYSNRERVQTDGFCVEADFTSTFGRVILTLCGHGHVDCAYCTEDGRVDMEIHCDAYKTNNGGSLFAREYGTVSEIAMDVVIVDRDTGSIQTVRYGAGESHSFS